MKHAERDSTEYQDSSTDHLLPDHEHGIFPISRDTSARDQRWWRRISITNLIILSINSILLIYLVKQAAVLPHSSNPSSQTPSAIRKHELVPAAEAIEYEDVTFSDSGFDARHNIPNIFEGPRTPAQDEAWMKLTTVGFVSLSAEQNQALTNTTAESVTHPGTYPVALGVFHQLHCLNYLRIQLFPSIQHQTPANRRRHDEHPANGEKENAAQVEKHTRHCLDYLRQVVQCHGDVTPLVVFYQEERGNYAFDHAVTHSCRKFERIYEWAVEHGADIHIEG